MKIVAPPVEQQARIAEFLDRESERIEGLQKKLSEVADLAAKLLQQKTDELLDDESQGVGRSKLGWHVNILSGYAFPSDGFRDEPDRAIRLLRGTNVGTGSLRWDDVVYWPESDLPKVRPWLLAAGDLVIGLDRPWIAGGLRIANVEDDSLPALLLQRVACIRPRSTKILTQYLRANLEGSRFKREISVEMTGVSVPHISPDQIARFRIPVPPLGRQTKVVRELEELRQGTDALLERCSKFVERLNAYRLSLITEAVTGQIDFTAVSEAQMDGQAHAALEGATEAQHQVV